MIDNIIFLPSACLGLLCSALYSVRCWRRGIPIRHGVLVTVILQAAGVTAGVLLIASTFSPDLKARLTGIDIYILISGVSVFAVSAQGLVRDVWTSKPTDTDPR